MADIRPFGGVHYSPARADSLAEVICPPYDIVSPAMKRQLLDRSRHNFIRLELSEEVPGDSPAENRYTRAAATFEAWLKTGVLQADSSPAIYLHDQHFIHRGKEYRRRGMVAAVRLEEWDKGIVRPHENTLSAPKSDRLNLLRALRAGTSPVFGMYEDRGRRVAPLLAAQSRRKPLFDFENDGERHRVWAVTGSEIAGKISSSLANHPLYIADGHHRYESALNYRNERRAASPTASPDAPFNFVMMTLADFADPGLVILPTHRMVRGLAGEPGAFNRRLKEFFEIEEMPLSSDLGRQLDSIWSAKKGAQIAIFGLAGTGLSVLRLGYSRAADKAMPGPHSEAYKALNVSIVEHIIIEGVLGLTHEKESGALAYTHDAREAVDRVAKNEYQLAILLSPIRAAAVKTIADAGDRMPKKSTYFYPKLPSGLLVYRMD